MAAKNTISQLDLVLLGRRGLTARIGSVEGQVKRLVTGSSGEGTEVVTQDLRPNLLTNSSFEFYDRGSTKPQEWTVGGGAYVSVGSAGVDGTNSLRLPSGASVSQAAAAGVTVPHASVVISVAARTNTSGQKISIELQHVPGYQAGPMMRIDLTGGLLQTDDVPADGQWYRFYKQFILTGGATAAAVIAQAGTGELEVDAAKLEKEDGIASWLEPTAYVSADWGAATHIRNLAADNIVAGTLVVGGSISTNPRISVKDGSDVEIVTIGDPTGGFYGVEIKGAAGFRISGTGSAEVLGGGSVKVKGGGDITVNGGNIVVTNGQVQVNAATGGIVVSGGGSIAINSGGALSVSGSATIGGTLTVSGSTDLGGTVTISANANLTGTLRAGTPANQRVELTSAGLAGYTTAGVQSILLDATTGKLKILGAGALLVSGSGGVTINGGGGLTVDDNGTITLTGSGKVLAGPVSGYHTEMSAGGVALYGDDGLQNILLSSITGKVHIFDDSLVMENGGKLSYVSGLVWSDNKGFWAMDAGGNAAFAVSGTDGNAWGNLGVGVTLDKGDVLIGNSSKYLWWDSSAGTLKLSGSLYAQNGNISIDTSGVYVQLPAAQDDTRAFGWKDSGGVIRNIIRGFGSATDGYLSVNANENHVSTNAHLDLGAFANSTGTGTVSLQAFKWNAGTSSYVSATGMVADTTTLAVTLNGIEARFPSQVRIGPTRYIKIVGTDNLMQVEGGLYFQNISAPTAPLSKFTASHSNDEFGNPFYTNLTWNGNGLFSVPNAPIQAPYLRVANGQQWTSYSYTRTWMRGNNVLLDGRLSFSTNTGGETTYFYSDDGSRTAHQGNLVVWGDVYVSNAGNWLSAFLNQGVKTTDSPTFGNVTIAGVGTVWGTITNQGLTTAHAPTFAGLTVNGSGTFQQAIAGEFSITVRNTHATSKKSSINLGGKVVIGCDIGAGGGNDFYMWSTANATAWMTINNSGFVGLGNISSATFRLQLPNVASAAGQGQANAWPTYSSRRWKLDIEPIQGALGIVERFQGVTYQPIEGDGRRRVGFIAEDVGAVVDGLVEWEDNGVDAQALQYDRITAIHNEAIKELSARVRELEARLAG